MNECSKCDHTDTQYPDYGQGRTSELNIEVPGEVYYGEFNKNQPESALQKKYW